MKHPLAHVSSILVAATALFGCGKESSPSKVDAADSEAQPSGMNLEGKAKDAVAKGQAEWKKFSETKLPEIDRKIAELKDKVSKASGSAKVELDKLVQEIGQQRKVLQEKLGELKSTGVEEWQSVSVEADHKLGELKKTIDQALEKTK